MPKKSKKDENVLVFPPSVFIVDELKARKMNFFDFKEKTLLSSSKCKDLLSGNIDINNNLAFRLAYAFGTTPQVWLNLQKSWDSRKKR